MTVATPALRQRLRANRGPILAVALLALVAGVMALTRGSQDAGYLSPGSYRPDGSRAVVTVLSEQGIEVVPSRFLADVRQAASEATIVVTRPDQVPTALVDEVVDSGAARIVLIGATPGMPLYQRLAAGVEISGPAEGTREPGCSEATATRSGRIAVEGFAYDARAWLPRGTACYGTASDAVWVELPTGGGRPAVTLLGSATLLTNEGIAEEGNAALALGMLGRDPRVVWWTPSSSDPAVAAVAPTLGSLVPGWVIAASFQLLFAAVLLALWRVRRLGRVVTEQLPVVVRASETTEGSGRLLHRSGDRERAAELLRQRMGERLAARTGIAGREPDALCEALASRSGRSPADVRNLLYGPIPSDDTALVDLHNGLIALEEETR